DHPIAGGVGYAEVDVPPSGLCDLPAEEPGADLGAAGFPARLYRHCPQQGRPGQRGALRRNGGAGADRGRRRAVVSSAGATRGNPISVIDFTRLATTMWHDWPL